MGIESDQLVFDYLSRIGDLAHRTSLTAAERARLVGGLRTQIDRMRAEDGGADSKAAVRKILGRLGRPEEVVAAANGGAPPPSAASSPAPVFPSQRTSPDGTGPSAPTFPSPRKKLRESRESREPREFREPRHEPEPPSSGTGVGESGAPPHLASMDELGPEESDPDWWRVDPSPFGEGGGMPLTAGDQVPGFTGGIELPEILKPPPEKKPEDGKAEDAGKGAAGGADEPADSAPSTESTPRRTLFGRLLGARAATGAKVTGVPRAGGIIELGAAILLVAGAVTGSPIPLAAGWLAAWWSPKLSRVEAKWAAAGMPGIIVAGAAVWLWGRTEGRWGDAIPKGGDAMSEAMQGVFPVLLRSAAVASALFLVWRSRRPAKG